jgi:N-acylneuraminate cytidylyltransferase
MLLGKEVVRYTIETAKVARRIDRLAVTTDDQLVKDICGGAGITVIDRPAELASSTARIDDALRHCVQQMEVQHSYKADIIVLLYGNVPVRAEGIIDRAVEYLIETEADSVQTIAPTGKYHPYWLYELDGEDKGPVKKYIENKIYRRQDLPPLYIIDGAVGVVRYAPLMAGANSDDPHSFWGTRRRAIVQQADETVDIDSMRDFYLAEAALRERFCENG